MLESETLVTILASRGFVTWEQWVMGTYLL